MAILNDEPGAIVARAFLPDVLLSAVNAAEVSTKLNEKGLDAEHIRTVIERFGLIVVPFESSAAYATGLLRMRTRALGLSLGDRACLALALKENLPAMTADRAWRDL